MGEHYLLEHAAGTFLCDEWGKLLESAPAQGKGKEAFIRKHSSAAPFSFTANPKQIRDLLITLATSISKDELRTSNLALTRQDMRHAIGEDIFLIQAIKSIADLDKTINSLTHRLRDWHELYLPEYSVSQKNHLEFTTGVVEITKEHFLAELGIESFGSEPGTQHVAMIQKFAERLLGLYLAKVELERYVDETMKHYCPNLRAVAGSTLGGKLLEHAGTLKRLAELPSSTIQILGAEKALFRHLKTGSRPPKHGVLLAHDAVQSAPQGKQGRAARIIADKISIAARIDYFKGEFIGDKLLLEAKKKIAQ